MVPHWKVDAPYKVASVAAKCAAPVVVLLTLGVRTNMHEVSVLLPGMCVGGGGGIVGSFGGEVSQFIRRKEAMEIVNKQVVIFENDGDLRTS